MRITTGIYKGRKLNMPKGIRPTQNITRKAIFDILGDIEGLSFLELFSGSGAVGIEAASRGAREVVFVENMPSVLKVLKENLTYILHTKYYILPLDALAAVRRLSKDNRKFDIIFLDPPYAKEVVPRLGSAPFATSRSGLAEASESNSLAKKTLQTLSAYDILSPAGLIIVQHPKKEILPERLGVLHLIKFSTYGSTALSFYKNPK